MKNWKRLLALFLSGAMALSLCACGPGSTDAGGKSNATGGDSESSGGFWDFFTGLFSGNESAPPSDEPSGDPDASATPEIVADLSQDPLEFAAGLSADDVLLTINGEELHADMVLYWLDYSCYAFMYQYGMYGASIDSYADMVLEDALSICSSEVVLRQRAAQLGCLPTDAQVQEARDSMAGSSDTVELFKTGYGLTDESIEYLFLSDAYYDNMLEATTHEPDEQELDEYIDAQGVFAVKHILLMTVDDSYQPLKDDAIAEKKALAEDLLAQLQAADDMPAKFDELMNEYSEDGGLQTNPDGYTFDSTASLVGGFREAALELEVGELSGIVETDYGYHIMLRQPLSDETRANYQDGFRASSLQDQVSQWVEQAEITRADALTSLNVADFYARINAYLQALSAQQEGGVG